MTKEVFDRAFILIGGSDVNKKALKAACAAAVSEILGRLKKEYDPAEMGERFDYAAAILALSLYMQLGDCGGIGSFKAGDVSVSRRTAAENMAAARSLRLQAETLLAGALIDGGFEFRGV